jgi:hypothetical protein
MFHAPMKSLAKSPAEIKKDMPGMPMLAAAKGPQYPYGCCISLDEATMKTLGLDGEMPSVGDVIHFCCTAKVTAVPGEREDMDGKTVKSGCVELQITEMGSPKSPDLARGERWYGGEEPDADE